MSTRRNTILNLIGIILVSQVSYGQETSKPDSTFPWAMHKIDNELYNHNSLSEGDVNQDGYTDYAIMHEGPSLFTFILHPGKGGNIRGPWEKIIVGNSHDTRQPPEYSEFGDFDGDGFVDIVGVVDRHEGLKMIWGPDPSRVTDPKEWKDGGYFEQTKRKGHFLYAQAKDINKDGAMDIVAGGRVAGTLRRSNLKGKPVAGVIWLEAPADKEDRRDLSKWKYHRISKTPGGRGFEFNDVDNDGDDDIVNCTADWNTALKEQRVVWYENPGSKSAAQKEEWTEHLVGQGSGKKSEFGYSKVLIAAGDIDGDGLDDLTVPTGQSIYFFRKLSVNPVKWEKVVIPRPDYTHWFHGPIALADLTGNGKLEIVGALYHDLDGDLPADKSSVYMMAYTGDKPTSNNWDTYTIKPSDGVHTRKKYQGEKWDHLRITDVDRDGDSDIVGNCEEHYGGGPKTIIGAAWFENPLITRPGHASVEKKETE